MCGIIGRIHTDPGSAPYTRLDSPLAGALTFLQRRGPDSWSEWQSRDGQTELLQVRLAIVDPDPTATQPFTSTEGHTTIAFNGEIYNYPELKSELQGYPFRTHSDTEVILAVYERFGVEGFRRLRGMFAFALYDQRAQRTYLVKDPVGKKPLYVARWGNQLLFGSSVLALVAACPAHAGAFSENSVSTYWQHGLMPAGQSLLQGCEALLPGEVREYDRVGRLLSQTDCHPHFTPERFKTDDEVRERAQALLAQSVRRRLLDNPCRTTLLSGGIDSTIVAAFMQKEGETSALTLGSLVPLELDEKYARYGAYRLGLPLQVLRPSLRRLDQHVAWAMDLHDEPLGMISFFMLSLLLRAAKDYGKIILTGDGGDEVFLGYGSPEEWVAPPGTTPTAPEPFRLGPPLPSWMSPWGKNTVTEGLLGHNIAKLDRAAAEQGIEARCPLLDWDLMAFARSLTPEQLFVTRSTKGVLKAQLTGWPRWYVERRKVGFAYRIRWAWGLTGYGGLREQVTSSAVQTLGSHLPTELRRNPAEWKSKDIFRHFTAAWKALCWSHFETRLQRARTRAPQIPVETRRQAGAMR